MKHDNQNILIDEHTREIVEFIPSAFQRWGIFLLLAALAVPIVGSYFVWYPETLEGKITIPLSECGALPHAILYVPPSNVGEIKRGAKVMVFTQEYPEAKYGFLRGRVMRIQGVPDENGMFKIEVSFPNGLTTSHGFRLSPLIQLSGTGEVVIRERRLIETIVRPLKINDIKD